MLPLLLSTLFFAIACGGDESLDRTDVVMPECTSTASATGAPTATDTLEILVRVLDPTPAELLVRVDALGDGTVTFPSDAPEGSAAAGLSLTTRGIYRVCVSADAAEVTFVADEAPFGKGWLRVTTDRPVRARLRLGGTGDSDAPAPVVVRPGSSGRTGLVTPDARVSGTNAADAGAPAEEGR